MGRWGTGARSSSDRTDSSSARRQTSIGSWSTELFGLGACATATSSSRERRCMQAKGKTDGSVMFANSDPRMIRLFLRLLRRFFDIDESRLRVRLHLHAGLDLGAATRFWSQVTGVPSEQFLRPYRAVPDPSIRQSTDPMGCPGVRYATRGPARRCWWGWPAIRDGSWAA